MAYDDGRQIEFALPESIKDFVFDLFQSTRRSLDIGEIQLNYDVKFREFSDKYFSTSPWPDAQAIAPECNYDEVFLLLYRFIIRFHIILCLIFAL